MTSNISTYNYILNIIRVRTQLIARSLITRRMRVELLTSLSRVWISRWFEKNVDFKLFIFNPMLAGPLEDEVMSLPDRAAMLLSYRRTTSFLRGQSVRHFLH